MRDLKTTITPAEALTAHNAAGACVAAAEQALLCLVLDDDQRDEMFTQLADCVRQYERDASPFDLVFARAAGVPRRCGEVTCSSAHAMARAIAALLSMLIEHYDAAEASARFREQVGVNVPSGELIAWIEQETATIVDGVTITDPANSEGATAPPAANTRPTVYDLAVKFVRDNPGWKPTEIAKAISRSASRVQSVLREAAAAGVVESRNGHYHAK